MSDPWQGKQAAKVNLAITPDVAGFPKVLSINPGETIQTFEYTFLNGPIPTGDPNDPDSTVSPSDTSPYITYLVTASIPPRIPNRVLIGKSLRRYWSRTGP